MEVNKVQPTKRHTPKVSVVIPVYMAEKYIERCVRSIFDQTLDSIEYIFVDDCSPDSSIEIVKNILEEYPSRKAQVNLIKHKTNQGVGKSRQDGIDAASGEYIIHCDPDDWVEKDIYERLYQEATEQEADIAFCNFYEEQDSTSYDVANRVEMDVDIPTNKKLFFHRAACQEIHMGLWNKLILNKLSKKTNYTFKLQLLGRCLNCHTNLLDV